MDRHFHDEAYEKQTYLSWGNFGGRIFKVVEPLKELQDPAEAAAYLNAAFQEGDPQMFLLALRDVAETLKK